MDESGTGNDAEDKQQFGRQQQQFVDGWDIVSTLGEGSYGEVKLLINQRSQQALALKIIDLGDHRQDDDAAKNVQKEIMIMKLLSHENIIKLWGSRKESSISYLFLEYAEGGELFDRIEPDVGMCTERAQFFFRQLISGVEYLHSRGVAHRDLKPENLLIAANDTLKISDFGMATVFRHRGNERLCKSRCGTLPYVAPEVLIREYAAEPADIWSCGVILVALLAGELPWDSPSISCPQFADWKEKRNLDLSPWKKIEIVALSLIKVMLQCSVDHRVTVQKIKTARWFVKDLSKQKSGLCRLNSGETQQGRKRCRFKQDVSADSGIVSFTQPEVVDSGSKDCRPHSPDQSDCSVGFNNASFSQPADMAALLIGTSQCTQSQNVNPLQRLVKRMTRFCVEMPVGEAMNAVVSACENCGWTAKVIPPSQINIVTVDRRRNKLSFKASIYPMGGRLLLVDFRMSTGDGLEFKRKFEQLKAKLNSIISKDSSDWLQKKGLSVPSMEQLSLKN